MAEAAKQTSGKKRNWADIAKWLVVIVLVGVGVFANGYFAEHSVLYRVLGLLALGLVAGFIAYLTTQGKAFWELVQGARTEIRRVVWPTQQETTTTTLVVVAVTIVMGLILWGLDSGFGWLVSAVIG